MRLPPRRLLAPLLVTLLASASSAAAAPPPKLGVMIAGIGYAEAPSMAAVDLPAAVSLALSPYGPHIAMISEAARKAGHELIMGLPMQPNDTPASNEGPQALDPDSARAHNQKRLDWALAQAAGYDGVTNALGTANGGGFMKRHSARAWLTRALAARHLFFIDTGPAPEARVLPGRAAAVLIDPDQGIAATKAALRRLMSDARASGSALAVVTEPAPTTIELLKSWLKQASDGGMTLVPVRDLVARP
jgi:polysaccharide deacetylase 2 family uncharacterized protein YibQ